MLPQILKTAYGLEAIPEYKFHPKRKWKFDYAILEHKIAIEIEGSVWTNGRHTRGSGFVKDMEKYNTATAMGWKLIRIVPNDYTSALFFIALILEENKKEYEVKIKEIKAK